MSIKDKMKYFIALAGKSQTELADEIGCTRYTMQMRISGGTNLLKMLEILNACNCDIYIRERETGKEEIVTVDDFPKKSEKA